MGKIRNPARFSTVAGIDPAVLRKRGAFDPILNSDTRLFIDPLLLSKSKHREARKAYDLWTEHFRKIIKLLKVATSKEDVAWRAAERLFEGSEFKGTCLGYGSGSIAGSGIGKELRQRMLATAHRIIELGVEDPELFALLPLLEDDLGPDRISDLTTRIIGAELAAYTTRVLEDEALERERFDISGSEVSLPVNTLVSQPGKLVPVVLTPRDVLRALPIATDWDGIADAARKNDALRQRLNRAIGDIWQRHTRKNKARVRAAALGSREGFEAILAGVRQSTAVPYDLDIDPEGRSLWLERGQAMAMAMPLHLELKSRDVQGVIALVETIIEQFRHIIEDTHGWKSLYGSDDELLREPYAQRLFFAIADSYCRANNIDISPESDQGGGPVDFKLSAGYDSRVVVELKYSDNSRLLRGYTNQLEAYKRAERTEAGYYLVLDVGAGGKQITKLLAAETAARNARRRHSPVRVVDARRRKSASKQ